MAGTNAVAAKAALRTLLAADSGFAGIQVKYSAPRDMADEAVYALNDIEGPVTLAAFRGSGANPAIKRAETLVGGWVIRVRGKGKTVEENETRACVLGAAFEGVVARNTALGGLTGLKLVTISHFGMSTDSDDEGQTTTIVYTLSYESHNE
ncbi:MAG: hypothetical protein ACM30G_04985 [Micromonosporaceae bacterium]